MTFSRSSSAREKRARSEPEASQKRARSEPEASQKRARSEPEASQKRARSEPEASQKRARSEPEASKKRARSEPEASQKRARSEPEASQKRFRALVVLRDVNYVQKHFEVVQEHIAASRKSSGSSGGGPIGRQNDKNVDVNNKIDEKMKCR